MPPWSWVFASIGLILSRAPADTDLSTIHTQAETTAPETTAETVAVTESPSVTESETVKEAASGISVRQGLTLPEIFLFSIQW